MVILRLQMSPEKTNLSTYDRQQYFEIQKPRIVSQFLLSERLAFYYLSLITV